MPVTTVTAERIAYNNAGVRYVTSLPLPARHHGRVVGPYEGGAIAFDCEGVIIEVIDDVVQHSINKKGCGRFSVVTESGDIFLDTFVYYPDHVDYRPPPQRLNLGVKNNDMKACNGARPIAEVVRDAEMIFKKAGAIVGHAVFNDIQMLRDVDWKKHASKVRDTQMFDEYMALNGNQPPGLAMLAHRVLGRSGLQAQGHSSVKDARATMELYLRRREAIDHTQDPSRAAEETRQWARGVAPVSLDGTSQTSDGFGGFWSEILEESTSSHTSAGEENEEVPNTAVSTSTLSSLSLQRKAYWRALLATFDELNPAVRVTLPNIPEFEAEAGGRRWNKRISRYV